MTISLNVIAVLFITVLLCIGWIISEMKGSKILRIILGVCVMVSWAYIAYHVGSIMEKIPNIYSKEHSIFVLETTESLLKKGQYEQVLEAYDDLKYIDTGNYTVKILDLRNTLHQITQENSLR